ncbi:MAG TPA: RnfABCDGE type electron transport complex subunit D, partial [Thermodesulfovibrionales bacterium]|nr:RnfABCDGE type electron transport complex subunit D [Thermodesulfovibrionales bacterium]
YRFPNSALITGLIIAALIEPELENRFIYLIAPALAILSKHLIRISGRNVFNPAAFGLLSLRLFYPEGFIVWWATTNIYLIIPLGLCIVLRMKGWHLVLSFMLATVPLYVIYGIHSHLNLVDSLNLINPFFVLFVLTEHKSAPVANKARIAYGCVVGVLSFLFHVFVPQVENSLTALLIGNVCAPIINRGFKTNGTH